MPKKSKKNLRGFLFVLISIFSFVATSFVFNHLQNQPNCANSKTCKGKLVTRIENGVPGIFNGKKLSPPRIDTAFDETINPVLGVGDIEGEKHIYVDLSTQTLYAFQGKTQIFKALISSGKWGRTPAGNFNIWTKLRATRMAGGSGADAYNLPNVPYVMYFYNDFGLHGAYWHNNFGHVMSHGCINMRIIDAKKLYDWADAPSGNKLGTAVSVCDSFTNSAQCIQKNPVK